MCPGCGGYGKPLGATKGKYTAASHCEACDIVFGWDRTSLPIPPPSNEIELGDLITALGPDGHNPVTGVVHEIEIGRDIGMQPFPDGTTRMTDRGPRNARARIKWVEETQVSMGPTYREEREEWVELTGAFIVEKSAGVRPGWYIAP